MLRARRMQRSAGDRRQGRCQRRFTGWYGLEEAGRLCAACANDLPSLAPAAAQGALEALVIYVGRLNFWLDSYIPWEELNALLQTPPPDA